MKDILLFLGGAMFGSMISFFMLCLISGNRVGKKVKNRDPKICFSEMRKGIIVFFQKPN